MKLFVDLHHIPDRLKDAAQRIDTGLGQLVADTTALLQTRVRGNASGRPGPRAQTGNYRRSIRITVKHGATHEGKVFTFEPYGKRLEYGFVGTDSLGRLYNQPPYPHWRPATLGMQAQFTTETAKMVETVLRQEKLI